MTEREISQTEGLAEVLKVREEWKQEQNSETTVGPCNVDVQQQSEPPNGETTVL